MTSQSPLMDNRKFDNILSKLRSNAQDRIPDWNPDNESDPGVMLQHTFGRLMEIIIERLNRVPEKQKLAFLDAMNISPLPPVPARAPVVFTLEENSLPLSVPLGTAITAKTSDGGPQVVFETTEELTVVPSAITCAYTLEPKRGRYGNYTDSMEGVGFTPFIGEHNMLDSYYFIEDVALSIERPKGIELTLLVDHGSFPMSFAEAAWVYSNGNETIPIEPEVAALLTSLTFSFVVDGKPSITPMPVEHLGGRHELPGGRFLKFTLNSSLDTKAQADAQPNLSARITTSSYERIPEHLFTHNTHLNSDAYFLPFGKEPQTGDSFYIHMANLLGIPNSRVTIKVQINKDDSDIWKSLQWYYSTQDDWKTISPNTVESLYPRPGFAGDTAYIRFDCPPDASPRKVSGVNGCWLRATLPQKSGGYVSNAKDENGKFIPLCIRVFSISQSMTYSNECKVYRQRGHIYTQIGDPQPSSGKYPELEKTAFYLGFDQFSAHEPMSLYADAEAIADEPVLSDGIIPAWEYLTQGGWKPLYVTDNTAGLSRSGMVRFLTPLDAAHTELFDNIRRYWVRISNSSPRRLNGLYLNAVPTEHAITVKREALGISNGYANQKFMIRGAPVLVGQFIWVRETEAPTAAELSETSVEVRQNPITLEQENWAVWQEQNSFGASHPNSRHYVLDRTTGEVSFGNGICGMVPEKGADISADYRYGGGTRGNLPVGSITRLSSAFKNIENVYNPIPATGGAQPESIPSILNRGPMVLRHRMRGVTAQDIEWLVIETAGASVDRVKCLPGDSRRPFTLILLPAEEGLRPLPDGELSTRIRNYLTERIPAALSNMSFGIIGPRYITVNIAAKLVPINPFDSNVVRERAIERLQTFLHPRFGGPGDKGWEFGRDVYLSEICAALESVTGVKHTLASTVSISPAAVQRELTLRTNDIRLEEIYPAGSLLSVHGAYGEVTEQWLLAETITSDILPAAMRVTGLREGDMLNITCVLIYGAGQNAFVTPILMDFPAGSKVVFDDGFTTTLSKDIGCYCQLTQDMLSNRRPFLDNAKITLVHPDVLEVTALRNNSAGYTAVMHCTTKDLELRAGIILECVRSKVKALIPYENITSPPEKYTPGGNKLVLDIKIFRNHTNVTLVSLDGKADPLKMTIMRSQPITDIAYLSKYELCTPGTIDIQIAN
ncbi:MAG: putative baseplate assembly protein [Dehalococcoidia bacterium]|nr:putative baseplate assembly protein [Dehalococcoidia bacterium]